MLSTDAGGTPVGPSPFDDILHPRRCRAHADRPAHLFLGRRRAALPDPGRPPFLGVAAALVAAALVVSGCGPGPTSSPTGSAAPASGPPASAALASGSPASSALASPALASPSASASATESSPWPDVSPDPLVPSPSTTTFDPPPAPSPAPAAVGLVLHVPVLMYHRIVPLSQAGDSLPGLVVSPQLFGAQMDAVAAAGWHSITAAQLLQDLAAGRRPSAKTFVITFDDGYDDGYTYALPILKAHGFVATFYVIAGRIGNGPGPLQALTPQHVQALAAAGMEIGNHTYNHVDLATASPSTLHFQVFAASARIQSLVGTAPTTLAYPFGAWSFDAAAEIKLAGIGIAFTTVEGAREAWATRYASPRVRVGPATTPQQLLGLLQHFSA